MKSLRAHNQNVDNLINSKLELNNSEKEYLYLPKIRNMCVTQGDAGACIKFPELQLTFSERTARITCFV